MCSVAIIGDIHDWHSEQIAFYLKKKGCEVIKLKYDELHANFNSKKSFFFNCRLQNVDAVWLRFLNSGTLEEITTKLTFLHLLEEMNIYTHNSAKVIEKTVDKVRTTGLLEINKIPSPETMVWLGNSKNLEIRKNFLLKPIFGSQGKDILFLKQNTKLKNITAKGNVFYLQEFIGNPKEKEFSDIRVLVSNHKVIAAMKRSSKKFVTNIFQGAKFEKVKLVNKLKNISEKVSKILNLGYGGIDIKIHKEKYFVLEVNSIPSWKTTQKIEKKNLSEILVNDFLKILRNKKRCLQKS
jgi:RimK family alpha-L-glutamate ligase